MKHTTCTYRGILPALLVLLGCADSTHRTQQIGMARAEVQQWYLNGIHALDTNLLQLDSAVRTAGSVHQVRMIFLQARRSYKRIEALVENFAPQTAQAINGVALGYVAEDDPNQVLIPPEGLQVIEADLYSEPAPDMKIVLADTRQLLATVHQLRVIAKHTQLSDVNVFDAMRRQLVRVMALGLSGYDTPLALNAINEADASIAGVQQIYGFYQDKVYQRSDSLGNELDKAFGYAEELLRRQTTFDTFDRLTYITQALNPLLRLLLQAQRVLDIPLPSDLRALRTSAATPFDLSAFDPMAFAPEYAMQPDSASIALGRLLFFDPILSGDNTRACASCHQPEKAFTDALPKSTVFDRDGTVQRNAPSLINAAFQASQFLDGRVAFLEDQAAAVIANPNEMHGSLSIAIQRLRRSSEYVQLFHRAFRDTSINESKVKASIASYVRSLVAMNSPFDRFMRGDHSAMQEPARRGFNLFMGKAKCGTCHFAPLFNGTVPPTFVDTESEILGVTRQFDTLHPQLDTDLGRFNVHGIEQHRFAFKTPTVRNVALTAPYFHNGAFATLDDVLEFYNRGGGAGLGLNVPGQTLLPDRLNMTVTELQDLKAFIEALTDTTGLGGRPHSLPSISDAEVTKRVVGGEY